MKCYHVNLFRLRQQHFEVNVIAVELMQRNMGAKQIEFSREIDGYPHKTHEKV